MSELTPKDYEEIQNKMVQHKQEKLVIQTPPTPDGRQVNESLTNAIQAQSNPDAPESRRIKKRIKGLWRNWRTVALDQKSLEIEKIACQIAIERAETRSKLEDIKRQNEIKKAQHWVELNKGNLKDIDANTDSKPSIFWYGLRRCFHHITKASDNIPKIFKNLLLIGGVLVGFGVTIIILQNFNIL